MGHGGRESPKCTAQADAHILGPWAFGNDSADDLAPVSHTLEGFGKPSRPSPRLLYTLTGLNNHNYRNLGILLCSCYWKPLN